MKNIFKSALNGLDESAERIYVYAFENDKEYYDVNNMTFEELCDYFDVFDEAGYHIAPGGFSHTYSFNVTASHVIMCEVFVHNI